MLFLSPLPLWYLNTKVSEEYKEYYVRFWLTNNLSMFIKFIDSYHCLLQLSDSPKLLRLNDNVN